MTGLFLGARLTCFSGESLALWCRTRLADYKLVAEADYHVAIADAKDWKRPAGWQFPTRDYLKEFPLNMGHRGGLRLDSAKFELGRLPDVSGRWSLVLLTPSAVLDRRHSIAWMLGARLYPFYRPHIVLTRPSYCCPRPRIDNKQIKPPTFDIYVSHEYTEQNSRE